MPTYFFFLRQTWMTSAISFLTALSFSSATRLTMPESRSRPSVSCVRSLEPIDMPSNISRNSSARMALEGISHIITTDNPFFPRSSPAFFMTSSTFFPSSIVRHDVVEAHFFAHLTHGLALKQERFFELRIVVAGSSAPAEHRIFFVWLKEVTPEERAVFVALKIGEADDDFFGVESSGDLCDAKGKIVNVVIAAIAPPARLRVYCPFELCVELVVVNEGKRVHADRRSDNEFLARKPHATIGQKRFLERSVG